MTEIWEVIQREAIYLWYYADVQFRQIFKWWIVGMAAGSFISVFLKKYIHSAFAAMGRRRLGALGIPVASALGIASPLCMYGTIPLAASFANGGMAQDWLGAFMMSSILLNPQLIFYSAALGAQALIVRIVSCFVMGCATGLLLRYCFKNKSFFRFVAFEGKGLDHDTDPNLLLRYLKNLGRNIKATGPYFFVGILLSAIFQRYVPEDAMTNLFGGNEAWGVLMAATIGVPLYACGGGTIPLLQGWLANGMSLGSAASFMLTGPSTKITNLGALKIVLGVKHFIFYLIFVMGFALLTGLIINLII